MFYNLPETHGLCLAVSLYNANDTIQIIDTDPKSNPANGPRRSARRPVPEVEVYRKHADVVATPTAEGLALSKTRKGWNNGLMLVAGMYRQWNFHIKAGTKITCGVCTSDVDMEGYVNKTNKGWGLYALYGTCGTAGPAKTRCCDPVQIGDIISVFLLPSADANFHTLAFAVNGKKAAASYQLPINVTYHGAVSLYGADDRVLITTGTPLGKPQNEYGMAKPAGSRRSAARPTSNKSQFAPGSRMSMASVASQARSVMAR